MKLDDYKFKNPQWEKDTRAMFQELTQHDIPVSPVPCDLQKALGIVAYCYDPAFFRFTSDDPTAIPLIHKTLHDIVVNNHKGSIDLDHHEGCGDVAVLSLPDSRNDPEREDRYMVYCWNK